MKVAYGLAPLSMGFSRQEYWRGLPFPPPGDLLDPGFKPTSLVSHALAGRSFPTVPPGSPLCMLCMCNKNSMVLFFFFLILAMAPAPTPRRCIPAVARGPPRCRDPGSPLPGIRHRLPDAEARVVRHLRATEVTSRLPAAGLISPTARGPAAPPLAPRRSCKTATGCSHPRVLLGSS